MRLLTKILISILALILGIPTLRAETKEQRAASPHEIRIGIGDPVISNATRSDWYWPGEAGELWRQVYGKPVEVAEGLMSDYRYSLRRGKTHILGHFFLEYQYRLTPYVGIGLNTDVYNVWNDYNVYNGYRDKVGENTYGYLYMEFVPRARFTFLHRQFVNLYASAGVGFAMYTSYDGKYFECAPKFEATLFGVSIGENHLFGAFEFMNLGISTRAIPFFPTQVFTASIGYRF